jgi:ATP-binding cassette subfamily F protein uup
LQQSKNKTRATADAAKAAAEENKKATTVKAEKPKKLSYKDQRELDALPAQIESFEEEVESLQDLMASDEFYKQDKDKIVEVQKQLEKTQAGLARCYTRWEQLEP